MIKSKLNYFKNRFHININTIILLIILIFILYPNLKGFFYKDISRDSELDYSFSREQFKIDAANIIESFNEAFEYRYPFSQIKKIEEKKEKLSNISTVLFHYSNEEKIKSFYNDYFKEPTIESLVAETARELSIDTTASFPKVVEVAAGGKDLKKWISTIKIPDISVNEMFRRYQKKTIENNQVAIGIELLDVDLTKIDLFSENIRELEIDYEFDFDVKQIEKTKAKLRGEAAKKTLERLEKITDWVLIDGKFKIEAYSDEFYKLIYKHPVNEFLEKNDDILITITLRKDSINNQVSGNYSQSIGQIIPLKVYGKIWQPLSMKTGNHEVIITPLAIY